MDSVNATRRTEWFLFGGLVDSVSSVTLQLMWQETPDQCVEYGVDISTCVLPSGEASQLGETERL